MRGSGPIKSRASNFGLSFSFGPEYASNAASDSRVRHAVVIEPCLHSMSPKTGIFCGSGRRLSANWPCTSQNWEAGDRSINRERPPLAGLSAITGRYFLYHGNAWLGCQGSNLHLSLFSIGFEYKADRSSEKNSNHLEIIVGRSGRGITKNQFRTETPRYGGFRELGAFGEQNLFAATKSVRSANVRSLQIMD